MTKARTSYFQDLIDRTGGHLKLVEPLQLNSGEHALGLYKRDKIHGHLGKRFVEYVRRSGEPDFSADDFLQLLEERGPSTWPETQEAANG